VSYLKSSFRTGLLEQPLVYLYIISSYGRGHEGGCDRNYSFHNDLSLYDRSDCSSISYPNLQPFLEIKKDERSRNNFQVVQPSLSSSN